jgi:hypothetical protein
VNPEKCGQSAEDSVTLLFVRLTSHGPLTLLGAISISNSWPPCIPLVDKLIFENLWISEIFVAVPELYTEILFYGKAIKDIDAGANAPYVSLIKVTFLLSLGKIICVLKRSTMRACVGITPRTMILVIDCRQSHFRGGILRESKLILFFFAFP